MIRIVMICALVVAVDDSWLYMTYEDLDELLADFSGGGKSSASQPFDPSIVADSMNSFISKQSNLLSGVEPPNR